MLELRTKENLDNLLAGYPQVEQVESLKKCIHLWQIYLHEIGYDNTTDEQRETIAALREKLSEVLI